MTEPNTAAGRALLAKWMRGNLLNEVGMSVEQRILAIEAETAARASALRAALLAIQDDPFTNHGPASKVQQMRWIARQALAALPPSADREMHDINDPRFTSAIEEAAATLPLSAPPALDVELLREWLRDNDDGLTEQDSADLVKRTRARLQEPDR